jgi:putative DNA-invertase from lambdoid prophage Rac
MTIHGYIRLSMGKQDEASQRSKIESLASRDGVQVAEWTIEIESRGVKWQERELARLLGRMQAGDWLYLAEVSRVGASIGGIFSFMEIGVERGISIRCADPEMTLDDSLSASVLAFAFGLASRIERHLIKSRTRAALQALKASGVKLGRPQGKAKSRRLDQFCEAIWSMKRNKVSDAAIGRTFKAHRVTVGAWLKDNPLPEDDHEQ